MSQSITNHPFYVVDKGWVAAGDLKAGDEVYNLDGTTAVVVGSEHEKLEETIKVYNLEVEDFHSYFVGEEPVLVHNSCTKRKEMTDDDAQSSSNIPVLEKTKADNGLYYKSNSKHTQGQPGNKPDAGIEPKNSLDLFGKSVASTKMSNARFTYDESTDTLHRFFYDGIDTWHWSGSTNQGANSLTSSQVPIDIKRLFNLPKKGW